LDDMNKGLVCLKQQLDGDSYLPWTVGTYKKSHPKKSIGEKGCLPVISVLPYIAAFAFFVWDVVSDCKYLVHFYNRGFVNASVDGGDDVGTFLLSDTDCINLEAGPDDYKNAFYALAIFLAVPLFCLLATALKNALIYRRLHHAIKPSAWKVFATFLSFLFPTAMIVFLGCKYGRARRKNKFRHQLRLREFMWAVVSVVEAGIESSGQIVLQCWLLSKQFQSLSEGGWEKI
jgi:uncharacterized membrane protein YhaH (DUF805 family)